MRRSLTARMAVAGAVLALAVSGVFALLLDATGDLRDSSRNALHRAQATAVANRAERLVLDAETASRGYVITGQPRFLEPLREAERLLPAELERLVAAEAHEHESQQTARELQRAALAYLRGHSANLVRLARQDPRAARAMVASGAGKRKVDAIRAGFDRYRSHAGGELRGPVEQADADARRATALAAGGVVASLVLIALFTGSLARIVVVPVRAMGAAAGRLAAGDLSVRLPERGASEVGRLARAFNEMAASLEESRDELESQNAELAMQTAELEDHHQALTVANDELSAQRDELERTSAQLAEEKHTVEAFDDMGRRLAGETDPERVARVALGRVVGDARADAGTFYAGGGEAEWRLLAAIGVARERLPSTRPRDDGPAGRAVVNGEPVATDHGEEGLRVIGVGGDVLLRHELHLPVAHGERVLGVVSLGWSSPRVAREADVGVLARLAARVGPNLAGAFALAEVRRLAVINRAVVDSVRDGVALWSRDGAPILRNRRQVELDAELLGADVDPGNPEAVAARTTDPEAYLAAARAIAADPDEPTFHAIEFADGRTFELYTAPVDVDAGRLGRVALMREVTLERQADRAKADLMATVSHELRTPLASVLGFTELMLDRDPDPERRGEYLRAIQAAAQRLEALIDDVLGLQRAEEGAMAAPAGEVALDEVLREQVELFSGQSRDHALELELPDGPLAVRGDRDDLTRVLANLLSNAIKYSPGGGRVRVHAHREDGVAAVSVSDEGIGIAADQREQVFDKFFRVDSSDTRTIGGTGLGLALVREIVRLHGGEVGVASEPGRGSSFRFTVPLA